MILFKKSAQLAEYLNRARATHQTIGFVPTMGALHKGHLSLIDHSTAVNDLTVCSIFVNPTQFNDKTDFQKYPVTIEHDIELLNGSGTGILYLPEVSEVYTEGTTGLLHYDLGALESVLEGRYRPGHFQGVCQVMHRLLNLVQPARLYMGQKDYQQCLVVNELLQIIGSNAELVTVPTIREPDGLALSSRNMRLDDEGRKNAVIISRVLSYIKANLYNMEAEALLQSGQTMLQEAHVNPDYLAIADATTLEPVTIVNDHHKLVALVAGFVNNVRLIDNMILN